MTGRNGKTNVRELRVVVDEKIQDSLRFSGGSSNGAVVLQHQMAFLIFKWQQVVLHVINSIMMLFT